MLNSDYSDMLRALAGETVEFLLVGAYAMAVHGHVRATMDLDVWVKPCRENAPAVLRALRDFGAPINDLSLDDLTTEGVVYQVGVAPCRIDILTSASGLEFDPCRARARETSIDGVSVPVLSLDDLIRNKRAVGRAKDLADVEALEALKTSGERPAD